MKFDIAIFTDGVVFNEIKNVGFLAVVAIMLGFPRKRYKTISFTISTSEDEETSQDVV